MESKASDGTHYRRSDIRSTQNIAFAWLLKYLGYPFYRVEKGNTRFSNFYFVVPDQEWNELNHQFYAKSGEDRGVTIYYRPEFNEATKSIIQASKDARDYGEYINLDVENQLH
jgi:hypothetical protein